MNSALIVAGVLVIVFALLLFSRADLRRGATARDDLAEARKAEKLRKLAEQAEALARAENEKLR